MFEAHKIKNTKEGSENSKVFFFTNFSTDFGAELLLQLSLILERYLVASHLEH